MSRRLFKYSAVVASLLCTAMFAGCGTSNKEGGVALSSVPKVDESLCAQCHGSSVEKLTGTPIYSTYIASIHANKAVGCQDCHGGGAEHNGVGPMPYPKPNHEQCKTCHDTKGLVTAYTSSKHLGAITEDGEEVCNRCHTHQGAVLSAKFFYTGDGDFMESAAGLDRAPGVIADAEPIKCNTCHVTHDAKTLRVDPTWNPGTAVGAAAAALVDNTTRAEYRLCTQCHGYIAPDGRKMGSGTTASGTALVGHHDTSWYRIIASTHYDDPATEDIEGYGVRTTGTNPCFDCHGHESLTNSNNDPASSSYDATKRTIYTDWAQSGHAGTILTAKFAAARSVTIPAGSRTDPARVAAQHTQVDAVSAAVADVPIENGASCVRCHTSTGLVQFMATPSLGGTVTYNGDGTATTVASTLAGTATGELTLCWGCHTNAGYGTLRNLATAKASPNYTTDVAHVPTAYALYDSKKAFPDVKGSNLCVSCHDGRNSNPAQAVLTAQTTPAGTHYMPAAGVMYVKTGFINFSTGSTYLNTLKADLDVTGDPKVTGSITSTHRKLGTPAIVGDSHNKDFFVAGNLDSNGPCVVCHLTGSHSLKMDQKAIDAVCSKCHDEEAGISIATKAAFDQHFLEPQSEVYYEAIALAADVFNSKQSTITLARTTGGYYAAYSNSATGTDHSGNPTAPYSAANYAAYLAGGPSLTGATAAEWTTVSGAVSTWANKTKLMGAVGNVIMFSKDKGGYAHARTYSRRLLYDSIDFLDNGSMDKSVGATALARSAVSTSLVAGKYGKGATAYTDGTLSTLASGTTESMLYLIGWSRSTGAWNSSERP